MNNEQWLPVNGYLGLYEVSDMGRVRACPKQYNSYQYKIMVQEDAKLYMSVRLHKDNKVKMKKVHRLEASHVTGKVLKTRKAVLSPQSVIEIYKSELNIQEVVDIYNISRSTYFQIKAKMRWVNILKNVA